DAKILLRIVIMDVETDMIAEVDQSREKFIYPVLLIVSPQADGIEQPPTPQTQIGAGRETGRRAEELPQIGVVKIRISIFVELPLARVIGLELEVQTIVIGDAVPRHMHWQLPRQRPH